MQDGINPEILFEDKKIIVAVKQPGMLSQSDFTYRPDILSQLKNYIKIRDNKPGNVYLGLLHRLDKEVGGIMVFAKNSKTAKKISGLIREHKFKKKYLAIVEGKGLSNEGRFEDYLLKDSKINFVKIASMNVDGAKLSSLQYKVLKKEGNKYLIEIELITGRSHQIRVQFGSRGFPLSGDKKYGSKNTSSSNIQLWAYQVKFPDPYTGKELMFKSNPPFTLQ